MNVITLETLIAGDKALIAEYEEQAAFDRWANEYGRLHREAGWDEDLFHVFNSNVGLTTPGKKIVLIGLNPTGALGRSLSKIYSPETGISPEDYARHVKREPHPTGKASKPSKARPRFEHCFDMVATILGEPVGLIITNAIWSASRRKKTLFPALRKVPAPLEELFNLIKGEFVVVVHGNDAQEAYAKLRTTMTLPDPVECPHFAPLGRGNLEEIAKEIAARFTSSENHGLAFS